MSDAPPFVPPEPTHPPLDIMKLFEIAEGLGEMYGEGEIRAEQVDAYAAKDGARRAEVYAALVFDPTLQLVGENDAKVEICTGRCQLFGSIDLLGRLLELKDERSREGKAGFDIVPRNCLDLCDFPPVVCTVSKAGSYAHRKVEAEVLGDILKAACDST